MESKAPEYVKTLGSLLGGLLFLLTSILAGALAVFQYTADYLAKATKSKPKKKEPEIKEAV